jgi:hypothetical protein
MGETGQNKAEGREARLEHRSTQLHNEAFSNYGKAPFFWIGDFMYLDTLFVASVAVVYMEPALSRLTGRKTATVLTIASVCGICWLLAIFIAEAI